ncbi:MAG: FAD-dependent oxidoreductase [Sphingomonadales bacterium]|nr:FAD-dependent oxidoreductase [Sphingomonadales bacterium]
MHPKYPNLFTPLQLGPVTVPTRFFFAPHGSSLTVGSKPSDELVAYSAARVRDGGCGMVVIPVALHERARTRQPSPNLAENVGAFRAYADAIHAAGGVAFAQPLYHWLGSGFWQVFGAQTPSLSPSVRQFAIAERSGSTRAMSEAEILGMIACMERGAANLAAAGFDGVMLHGSHASMVEQFLSPYYNERDDRWGGSLENRMRFMVEMLSAARRGSGGRMAIGMRLNCDEQIAGGYDTATAREVVSRLCAEGLIDYIDLDVGMEPQQFHHGMPHNFIAHQFYRPAVEAVRGAATVPVLSVLGSITDLAEVEAAIADGVIDMGGAARQLIAEPDFVQNARNGREDRSRTCIRCNWCTAAGSEGVQGCTINPASYRERTWGTETLTTAAEAKRVVVIGGGPGGLEAARVAALRGHKVVLLEAREALGGALALWAKLPGRGNYGTAIGWWQRELAQLHVDVRLGGVATAEAVLVLQPDAVIVATGAVYSPGGRSITMDADIPGSALPHVLRPEDVLVGGARPGGRVLLADGEGLHASTGLAELLAAGGAEVVYATARFTPVSGRLVDAFEARQVVQRLKQAGVRFAPTTWVRGIEPGAAVLYDVHTGEERREGFDAVVLVTGRVPQDGLARELAGRVAQVFTIGDALSARTLAAATFEGHKFARLVGEAGAPADFAEAFFRPDDPSTLPLPADVARPTL